MPGIKETESSNCWSCSNLMAGLVEQKVKTSPLVEVVRFHSTPMLGTGYPRRTILFKLLKDLNMELY